VVAQTDIQATIQRLADIANAEKAVTGISIAYPDNPASLTTLPAVCYFAGQQTYEPFRDSEDAKLEKMVITIAVYVDAITLGIPGEVESRIKRMIPLMRDSLLAHPSLSKPGMTDLVGVLRAVLLSSSGPTSLTFAQQSYAGCSWKMSVERILEVIYDE
jgi:hypothetical protein